MDLKSESQQNLIRDAYSEDGEGETFLPPSSPVVDEIERGMQKKATSRRQAAYFLTAVNLILFLISLSLFFPPVLNRIDLPMVEAEINGTLFPPENPSIYRQEPSPEVDDAWFELEKIRAFAITSKDMEELGKDTTTAAKFPEDAGFGSDAYMAQVDVFHQIHCLNLLRKAALPKYYPDGPTKKSSSSHDMHLIHVSHCADVLLQNLMCTASTDVLTFDWMETQARPFPQFTRNAKCRDFGTLQKFQEENTIELDKWIALKKPEGVMQVPAPAKYYEIFRDEHSHT
ncbi:MAG: Transcription initiation factor TFIID subunit 5 [Chaenotheca gracillima]|nr:MAG: Transcription initiation factor TFIID subunit 5 [Chaenotheca gracillima]